MPCYVVSYDLNNRQDYPKLWDELKRLGGHRPLESVWFLNVDSPNSAHFRDHLADFIDQDDQLIVVEFSKKPAHQKAKKGTNDWIANNVSPA